MKEQKERVEYRHERCGALLVSDGTQISADEDCPVCEEVREAYRRYGLIRASAGTPLAEELGLTILPGKVGIL